MALAADQLDRLRLAGLDEVDPEIASLLEVHATLDRIYEL